MEQFLQTAYRYVSAFSYYLPHALGSLLFLALTVFIIFKVKKKKEDSPAPIEGEDKIPAAKQRSYRSASTFKLRRNLRRALSTLRANIYGRNYRYQIPWFLLIGETEAGKTEALRHTEITLPLGAPAENLEGSREGWKFWFFDQGIVIDVDGDYVLRNDGRPADNKGWRSLLNLLQTNRPQRPIDGAVLAIPATDLIGSPDTLNERVIKVGEKAAALFEKLATAQKILGMRFPVYIMVTKCDQIRGFKSFCGELPEALRQDIFGWSNPYTVDAAYTPVWIDEAFQSLYKNLYQTQIEVIVDGIQVQDSDSFFMFPSQFQSMLEPLKTYANHLFKQSVYHEAFFFRGLFFSGDTSTEMTIQASPASLEEEDELGRTESATASTRKLGFLKDLFEMKIFPEFRLARPTAKIFLWRNRLTWFLRTAVASVATIWMLGMLWGYNAVENEKQTLVPLLQEIDTQLTQLKVRGPEEESSFNKMALNLLKGMTNVNTSSLSSIFIPSSWFSDLDDRIRHSMVVAYDKIILKSLFFELEEKVKSTLESVDERSLDGEQGIVAKGAAGAPVKFEDIPEVQRLQKVVRNLDELWKNIEVYNGLQNTQDLTQLGLVVKFLFGFDLPVDFYKNAEFYHNALKEVEYRHYDPTIARYLLATPKVRGLAQDLYIRMFEENIFLTRLEDFATELESITDEDPRQFTRHGVHRLKALNKQIENMETLVASPEFTWIGRPNLDLGPTFSNILDRIEQSAFLGATLRHEIQQAGEEGFSELIFQIRGQKTSFTGPLLKQEGGHINLQLSAGVAELKTALQEFLDHDFMTVQVTDQELITDVAPNDRLMWNEDKLESSIGLFEDFDKFNKKTLPRFPEELNPLVKSASMHHLEAGMNELIGEAQSLKQIREDFAFSRREDELASEVRNFKKTAPQLGKLMDIFFQLDFTDSSWALFDLVTKHAYHLLNNVDRLLQTEALYEFKDGDFSWWTGLTPVSLAAYDALDEKELSYYLTIQRERVKHLAREYAEPLVNFLVNRTIKRGQMEERLVTKWHRILVEMDRYEARQTRNSLTLLERFIQVEMETVNPENCLKKISQTDLQAPVKDYFGEKLHRLKLELSKQCRLLGQDEVLRTYSTVQAFFNDRLAGKFPFAPLQDRPIVDEAEPEDLRRFYHLLDRYLDQGLGLLEKSTKFGLLRDNALEFIYLMEEARPFFSPFLGLEKLDQAAFLLDVDFRVNREAEAGANQVIEWEFDTAGQTLRDHQKKQDPVGWNLGDPIQLNLRWAKNSPDVPVSAGDWPGIDVHKRSVSYRYENDWSLIQLLLRHEAKIEDFGPLGDPKPHTLRFAINTLERNEERLKKEVFVPGSKEARIFVRVVLRDPKTKERVLLPALPHKAPQLKQDVNS